MVNDLAKASILAHEPAGWLIGTLIGLAPMYLLALGLDAAPITAFANVVGPVTLGLALALAARRLLRYHAAVLWTPYAWFLLGAILFFAVGPLVYPLGSADQLVYVQSLAPVTPYELLRTNLLDTVGVTAILCGFRLAQPLLGPGLARTAARSVSRHASLKGVAICFLVVGGALQYLVSLPFQFGAFQIVLPGVLKNLGDLYLFGLMALAYMSVRSNRLWRILFAALWIGQMAIATLVFSKHQLLLTMIMPALGLYLARPSRKRLIALGLVAIALYASVGNLVLWGRNQIYSISGDINQASLSQRVAIIHRWVVEGMPASGGDASSATLAWARLDYAGVQAYAMRQYDNGFPGHTLRDIGIVLIPRFLWPDKPVTTDMAVDFYQMLTGNRTSHLGLGLFGEGYWDYGWFGVVLVGFVTGFVFMMMSWLSLVWMERGAFEYMPSIFIGINAGMFGITQFFVNSIFGAGGLFVAYAFAAWLVFDVANGRRWHQATFQNADSGRV